MPNRRKADALHRAARTFRRDRHGKATSTPEAPAVGLAPAYFGAQLRAIWSELATGAPWLTPSDRHALELACRALGELRGTPSPAPALLAQVGRALDRIALSTSARGEAAGVRDRSPQSGGTFSEFARPKGDRP